MKQFVKVLAKVIAIPCGCLCLLAALAFLLVANLFKASPSDIREGNEALKQIFISLDMPPKKKSKTHQKPTRSLCPPDRRDFLL